MLFEWDENKDLANQRKHQITFEMASFVFKDPFLLSELDHRPNYSEERWRSIGFAENNLICVAHTAEEHHEEEIIRIISARKANSKEGRRYYINRNYESAIPGPQRH